MVDAARMPVYLLTQWADLKDAWLCMLVATVGCILGTLVGQRLLRNIPEAVFRRVVSAIILALGLALLVPALTGIQGIIK
jgi:uncharacterized membrane protein YfcA